MFIKKDTRKIPEIIEDESDTREHMKLARRGAEFANGVGVLCADNNIPRLQALRVLSMYSNQLNSIDGIGNLSKTPVEEINLGQNQLEDLPDEFGTISTLQRLWIDGNKLGPELPSPLLELGQLRVLRASNNAIAGLPDDIGTRLPLLEVLAVDNNCLESIPDSVYQLNHLEKLIIRGNRITAISESVGMLTNLKIVQASSNCLSAIPATLGKLEKIEELYLNSNQIVEVPSSLSGLLSAKKISLANNRILSLPAVLEEKWKLDGAPGAESADAIAAGDNALVVELFGNPFKSENAESEILGMEDTAKEDGQEPSAAGTHKRQKMDAVEA